MDIKHIDAIEEVFSHFRESWMDDTDYLELKNVFLEQTNYTYEKMSHDIEVGVKNGYSVETQVKLIKDIIAKL